MENGFSRKSSWGGVLAAAVPMLFAVAADAAPLRPRAEKEHVKGELLVKLKNSGMTARAEAFVAQALTRTLGEGKVLQVRGLQTDAKVQRVKLKRDSDVKAAIAALNQNPAVQYAEPNYILRRQSAGLPNDAEFGKLWGLSNVGQADAAGQVGKAGSDIHVTSLWEKGVTGSKNILVAVIDTGIDFNHDDLKANIYTNSQEIADNEKDDDGNGFVDDVHGYDFANKRGNGLDDHNHGTHCAGTIGGVGNNGKGVAGVNWNVTLLPVKFLTASGSGSLADAVESINYATQMKVNIMSNSWGGGGFSQTMMDAIKASKDAGILFVAAAGNDSSDNDADPAYPASYEVENVVSVAATDNQDKIAYFSNFGERKVHVAAPGVKVYSTTKGNSYDTFSGTSMATPHVAGAAALLWSANPTWTFAEIKDRLIRSSDPVRGLKKKVVAKGRINVENAYFGVYPPSSDIPESSWVTVEQALESEHPYKDQEDKKFTVTVPGAKHLRVIFEKVDVEARYDHVMVENAAGEVMDDLSGQFENHTSEYVDGDTAIIHLTADESNTGFGFKISKVQVVKE